MLTRDQLVGKRFLPFEEVSVDALGGNVGVQGMTAGDAVAYYKIVEKQAKNGGMDIESLAKLLVRCLVDDNRARIFSDEEWPELMNWPNAALQKIALVAMRLNNGSAEGN